MNNRIAYNYERLIRAGKIKIDKRMKFKIILCLTVIIFTGCSCHRDNRGMIEIPEFNTTDQVIMPEVITEPTLNDTDDPAIWINQNDPAASLILGTDKGNETGGIYVFRLDGKIDLEKSILNLKRPNNIDIEYGFKYPGGLIDIAAFTERGSNKIRVFSLPGMKPIDDGGVDAFENDPDRLPMGIALYKDPNTSRIYAIVSRKSGHDGSYLWEYLLEADSSGKVIADKVREFGNFKGNKEIEAIVADDQLGYIYYSDETYGVHQYFASPDSSNQELGVFATKGISGDQEGLSIFPTSDSTGYIIVSDQQANKFHIYSREGSPENPYHHRLLKVLRLAADESDGSEVTAYPLNKEFNHGLFVAMSNGKTFHFYRWEDIAGHDLEVPESTGYLIRLESRITNR
jgi:3-phytase